MEVTSYHRFCLWRLSIEDLQREREFGGSKNEGNKGFCWLFSSRSSLKMAANLFKNVRKDHIELLQRSSVEYASDLESLQRKLKLLNSRIKKQTSNYRFAFSSVSRSYNFLQESVRGCDCYIVQTSNANVNDLVMETLIMTSACVTASANRVFVVLPCFPYSRLDQRGAERKAIGRY